MDFIFKVINMPFAEFGFQLPVGPGVPAQILTIFPGIADGLQNGHSGKGKQLPDVIVTDRFHKLLIMGQSNFIGLRKCMSGNG